MHYERQTLSMTTNGSGAYTGYTTAANGRIVEVVYTKTTITNATFAVTGETTGIQIWGEASVNASTTFAPQQAAYSVARAALLYAAAGQPVTVPIALANERIKVQISSGGATTTGTITFVIEGTFAPS